MTTLYAKLQDHFNAASRAIPAGRSVFDSALRFCREHITDDDISLPMKGLVYRVTQVESSFEEGKKMVGLLWKAHDIIREHKGPRI